MAEETKGNEGNEHAERGVYELGYHIVPAVGEENLTKEVSAIKGLLEKLSGTIVSEEYPAHVTLAYAMLRSKGGKREKFSSAYFGWIKFELLPTHVSELRDALNANDRVLRFIVFKTVREDTRAPKQVLAPAKPSEPIRPKLTTPVKKDGPKEEISDAELDKTIADLVVE